MERLYDEDVESKLEGANMILQLAEYAGNIEALVQNKAIMVRSVWSVGLLHNVSAHNALTRCMQSLLSRVLNDDYKKSYDFTLAMMRIFWCFSNFLQLHPVLANYASAP